MINSQTTLMALIGSPTGHSMSPIIHNKIYSLTGRNAVYLSFDVEKENLAQFIESAKLLNIKGFNITMPHKENIIKYIDNIEDNIKSVNTVKIDANNKLVATSTDGGGFLFLLEKNNIDINNKNVAILGTGGVSSIITKTLHDKCDITLIGKNEIQLKNMSEEYNCKYLLFDNIEDIKNIDILINGTPLGMQGFNADFDNFNFLKNINKNGHVIDTIYKPKETNLLKQAKSYKLNAFNGLDMLLGQAVLSHNFWFDEELKSDIIAEVEKNLLSNF